MKTENMKLWCSEHAREETRKEHNKPRHTPTPWMSSTNGGTLWIGGGNPNTPATKNGFLEEVCTLMSSGKLGKANAEFIVRAVNCHEELVKTLNNILSHNDALKSEYRFPVSLVNEITKVLTKAEGKEI